MQDEYYSKVEEVQSKITKLDQDYQNKLADRTQEIFSAYDLFDQVPERQKVSGDKLVNNLKGQIATIEEFYDGLQALSERGVGDALVDDIRNMGPDAIGELNALLSLTDEKLGEYAALYQEKQALASELATQELAGLRDETNEQISQSLLELQQIYDEYAPVVGEALPDGLAEGIRNGISSVISAATEMAQSAVSVVKNTLGIHSPSTVFAGLGKNSAEGFYVGFEDEMTDVAARMQRSIPVPTIDTVNNAAAGMVNGLSTMAAGQSFPSTIVLKLENGAEIARWLLPDLRRAGQANPEVASGV